MRNLKKKVLTERPIFLIDCSNGSHTDILVYNMGPYPIWGLNYGPPKLKFTFWQNTKWPPGTLQFFRQKKYKKNSDSMSLGRSNSTSRVSDEIYGCYGQKTDFSCFLNLKALNILIRFEMLLLCSLIFFFF